MSPWWPIYDFTTWVWYRVHCCTWDHHGGESYIPHSWSWRYPRLHAACHRVCSAVEAWLWKVDWWVERRIDSGGGEGDAAGQGERGQP